MHISWDMVITLTSHEHHGVSLRWRHNDHDGVSNHQPHHCLLNCLFGRRSKKTSKLRVTGLCAGNSPGNSPHKWPVTRKMFPFDDVIMSQVSKPLSSPHYCSFVRGIHEGRIPLMLTWMPMISARCHGVSEELGLYVYTPFIYGWVLTNMNYTRDIIFSSFWMDNS